MVMVYRHSALGPLPKCELHFQFQDDVERFQLLQEDPTGGSQEPGESLEGLFRGSFTLNDLHSCVKLCVKNLELP